MKGEISNIVLFLWLLLGAYSQTLRDEMVDKYQDKKEALSSFVFKTIHDSENPTKRGEIYTVPESANGDLCEDSFCY